MPRSTLTIRYHWINHMPNWNTDISEAHAEQDRLKAERDEWKQKYDKLLIVAGRAKNAEAEVERLKAELAVYSIDPIGRKQHG